MEWVTSGWSGRIGDGRHATRLFARWLNRRRRREAGRPAACSFCGKMQAQVTKIIAGPGGVYICNECVGLCNDILAEELVLPPDGGPPSPSE